MKRGIVMSVHAKHAVVMTAEGQFLRAPLQGSPQIGEEIVFEEEQSEPRRVKWNRVSMRYAALAATLGIMLIAGLAYAFSATHPVVAYLTMDINPSVEIGVDGDEKVRRLRALNKDGEQIIAGIAYKGVDVETVAAAILEQASKAHYLDAPHKDILITSVLLNGKKQPGLEFESLLTSRLDEKLQKWLGEHTAANQAVTITTLSVPESLRVEADANGISSGKMAVYLMAKYEGHQVELSKLKEESIDSWSEPIGGMKSIVDTKDDAATKEKLEKLLAKEKKEQKEQKAQSGSGSGKGLKPAPTASSKPSAKPSVKPTARPSVKPSETGKPNRHGWWHDRDKDDRDDDDEDDDDDSRTSSSKWNNRENYKKWENENGYKGQYNGWSNSNNQSNKNNKDNKNGKDNKSDKDHKNNNNSGKNGNYVNGWTKYGNENKGESDKNSNKNDQKGNKNNDRDKDSTKKGSRNEKDSDDDEDDRSDRNRGGSDRDRDSDKKRSDGDNQKSSSRDSRQHSGRD
ncbi:anti-sigma factor domain-containing protein [Paenibacillus sp. 1011MAR3C5]|uniref:anti-sigma factor domain-containing protein n=1 Tax=Paenibacillus sp. 1011MAR3C5 TaxID=1675787 RepID=UPI000E6D5253|nr:anti-sigma factor domain-containing protein [Paenibacillus sp. 1011MAR3C5]RJE91220.1 anti-sigma factor domain-containing protein [Paenibacillus sp. 1011MAR3C5]